MPDGSVDVLMRVVGRAGPFKAESSTQFAVSPIIDTLRRDFEPGRFCELREFSFSAGVASALSKTQSEQKKLLEALNKQKLTEQQSKAVASAFDKWGKIREEQNKKLSKRQRGETVEMKEVEFTRVVDSASTLLFKALAECETLETVSIVKRKAGGRENSGLCFLRMDFDKVLVTDLSWKDDSQGHVLVEQGKFIYRTMTLRYRTQKADGTLGPVVGTSWEMKKA